MAQKQIMIGTKLVIQDKTPIMIQFVAGKENMLVDPRTLIRLGEQFISMGRTAVFLEAYRMKLTVQGEPQATQHAMDLLQYLGGLATNDSETNGKETQSKPGDNISQISDYKAGGNASASENPEEQ